MAEQPAQVLSPAHFRLDLSGFATNLWRVDLPEKQTFEDCMQPRFWTHVAFKIAGDRVEDARGIGDEIAVFKRDVMEKRNYLIAGIGAGWIKLVEFQRAGIALLPDVAEDSPLKTRWNPGKKCHEVVRVDAPGVVTVMQGGFQDRNGAVEWIANHTKAMAA